MRIRYAEIAVIFIGLFSPGCQAPRLGGKGLRMTSQRGCIKEVLALAGLLALGRD